LAVVHRYAYLPHVVLAAHFVGCGADMLDGGQE
jgi:hypothetical protein